MKTLKKLCFYCVERYFYLIDTLKHVPGTLVQELLSFMMKQRRKGSRTLSSDNVHVFLEHEFLLSIDLSTFWLSAKPFQLFGCSHLTSLNLKDSLHEDSAVPTILSICGNNLHYLNFKNCNITEGSVYSIAEHCHMLEFLSMTSCKRAWGSSFGDAAIITLISSESIACKLKTLKLYRSEMVTDKTFAHLARRCSAIENIVVLRCSVTSRLFEILSTHNLGDITWKERECHSSYCGAQQKKEPKFTGLFCGKLKSLKVKLCQQVRIAVPRPTKQDLSGEPVPYCDLLFPHLEALVLSNLDFAYDLPFLQSPKQCPLLRCLRIVHCNKLNTYRVMNMSELLCHLEVLELRELTKMTSSLLGILLNPKLPMKHLSLHGCLLLYDPALSDLPPTATSSSVELLPSTIEETDAALPAKLEHLAISITHMSGSGLFNAPLKNLTSVQLSHSLIDNTQLLQLAICCSCLENVVMADCHNLRDAAVTTFVTVCTRLTNLDLSKCKFLKNPSIVNESLETLTMSRMKRLKHPIIECPSLRIFDFSSSVELEPEAIVNVLEKSPNLKNIWCAEVPGVTDDVLLMLPDLCTRLSVINLSGLVISPSTLEKLAAKLPKLRRLFLNGCKGYTSSHAMVMRLVNDYYRLVITCSNGRRCRHT